MNDGRALDGWSGVQHARSLLDRPEVDRSFDGVAPVHVALRRVRQALAQAKDLPRLGRLNFGLGGCERRERGGAADLGDAPDRRAVDVDACPIGPVHQRRKADLERGQGLAPGQLDLPGERGDGVGAELGAGLFVEQQQLGEL